MTKCPKCGKTIPISGKIQNLWQKQKYEFLRGIEVERPRLVNNPPPGYGGYSFGMSILFPEVEGLTPGIPITEDPITRTTQLEFDLFWGDGIDGELAAHYATFTIDKPVADLELEDILEKTNEVLSKKKKTTKSLELLSRCMSIDRNEPNVHVKVYNSFRKGPDYINDWTC